MSKSSEKFAERMNELAVRIKSFLKLASNQSWDVQPKIDLWDCYIEMICSDTNGNGNDFIYMSPNLEFQTYTKSEIYPTLDHRADAYACMALYALLNRQIKMAQKKFGIVTKSLEQDLINT